MNNPNLEAVIFDDAEGVAFSCVEQFEEEEREDQSQRSYTIATQLDGGKKLKLTS